MMTPDGNPSRSHVTGEISRKPGICHTNGYVAVSTAIHLAKEMGILQKYLFIAAGGAFGSIARYWVASSITNRTGTRFPYGTLIVNLSACFVIGFCLSTFNRRPELHPAWRYLIPIGFIGAYSTFSTFEWEAVTTVQAGAFLIAVGYVAASLLMGFVSVWAGMATAKVLW